MIAIRFKGGLGNQMFQYAFGRSMASTLNTALLLDCSLLLDRARGKDHIYRDYDLDIFNITESFIIHPSLLTHIYKLKISKVGKTVRAYASYKKDLCKERHFRVDTDLIKQPRDNTTYEGWWQSEQYFSQIKNEIKSSFSFKYPLIASYADLLKDIHKTNSVCLNVRRTDFLQNTTLNVTNLDYFLRAAKIIAAHVDNPHFFIFSDDIKWCKDNILLKFPSHIVDHNIQDYKFSNYLRLMKSCKHFIIPNSSFAWWAVWLCDRNDKIVVAPKKWFNDNQFDTSDLIPREWIRI